MSIVMPDRAMRSIDLLRRGRRAMVDAFTYVLRVGGGVACFSVLALNFSAYGGEQEPIINKLLGNIRAELPKGWTASYDKENLWLQVSRDEKVLSTFEVINGPAGGDRAELEEFVFAFRVMPGMTQAEYRRLKAENARIEKEAQVLYESLVNRKVPQELLDGFLPRSKEETVDVARLEALKTARRSLPDFAFGAISLQWGYGAPSWPTHLYVVDDKTREECAGVEGGVLKLLEKFEERD